MLAAQWPVATRLPPRVFEVAAERHEVKPSAVERHEVKPSAVERLDAT
jgi:hypothetical protein